MRINSHYNIRDGWQGGERGFAVARLGLFLCCIVLIVAGATGRVGAQNPPQVEAKNYVSDFGDVLSRGAVAQLTALCTEVEQKTQAQIAVITVKSLDGRSIEDYSIDLATQLGVGPKATSRGVLILLAVQDHRNRIEVGYGLEPILPDGKTGSFLREATPILRTGNYDAALLLMARRVADVIAADRGVTLTASTNLPAQNGRTGVDEQEEHGLGTLVVIIVAIFIIWSVFSRMGGGGRRGSGLGGIGGGWIIGSILGSMMGGGYRGGGGFGGGGFGAGGGGGGFGGFGGGSFGGGGASGSW
jgi:uncharacterized protein